MSSLKGYWIPVLHSHLPFVKHPDFEYFLEEHWLFEAISECYIPLLMRMKNLEDEGVRFRLTTSITPPLAEMLNDDHLMRKYYKHLEKMLELCDKEMVRLRFDGAFRHVAEFYKDRYSKIVDFFNNFLGKNVLNGYRYFSERGYLEIITCGATHGFLPLLSVNKKAVEIQIEVAVKSHTKHFGSPPNGIWLPECAYYDGLDEILATNGIKFFFLDSHGLVYGSPTPKYGVFAPVFTPNGVAAFGRDPESSKQVWSSIEGYPGDFNYRDFYKDIGFELDYEYIKPYIDPNGVRVFTGMKYYKITGKTDNKEPYNPHNAYHKAIEHAAKFHFDREKQVEYIGRFLEDRLPVVISPYDAELFGHWWFEGPDFLYGLFKEIDRHGVLMSITPTEYLDMHKKNQVVVPSPSSWGDRGYYDVWLNGGNDWIYRHLHFMADKVVELAERYKDGCSVEERRVLNQMVRELLLAQSSDWAFLMTTQTAFEYSVNRTKEHISNFNKLLDMIEEGRFDFEFIQRCEYKNSIFEFLDYKDIL